MSIKSLHLSYKTPSQLAPKTIKYGLFHFCECSHQSHSATLVQIALKATIDSLTQGPFTAQKRIDWAWFN